MAATAAPKQNLDLAPAQFPSLAWFSNLATLMNANRARQEQLGYVDCTAGFRIMDESGAVLFEVHIVFDEFEATDVLDATVAALPPADFVVVATLATWREMIENIRAGGGTPDLEHTLNRLTHMGVPMRLTGDDVLRTDLYFRYAQSLQEFFNACAQFETVFA